MSKLVECKSCKKEIAKGAKVCPHCGQKNPTVNMLQTFLGFVILVVVISFFLSDNTVNDKHIYKKDYGDKWAFTVDEATLVCYKDNDIKSPVIVLDGKAFGLTGFADNIHGQKNLNAINQYWLKDEKLGINKDLGIFTKEALKLCE
jgi:RNA polymerase subunit RPABC4/transcription elongation factor Spt4